MNLVITMSRRFGTGASIIAKELSERLHIPVYDKDDVEHGMRENAFESEADAIRELARGSHQSYHEVVFSDKRSC